MRGLGATRGVLGLLCLMYLITYVDRVNIGTAAPLIKGEFHLSNVQLGFIFSAFAYPYALFQVSGGLLGDRYGARRTLFACGAVWALGTILTGLTGGFISLFAARVLLGLGEGATFPTATRAMQNWTALRERGFAQGITHSFARLGNAITPPLVAALAALWGWRGSFVTLGLISLAWVAAWWFYFRDDPKEHRSITPAELDRIAIGRQEAAGAAGRPPWKRLVRRIVPVTVTYFCYGWTLWLLLNWLPSFFKEAYHLDLAHSALFSSTVFFAGVVGDTLGGVVSDRLLTRTGDLQRARRDVIVVAMCASACCLGGIFLVTNLSVVALLLSGAFFFLELVIGPIWSIPMDIAPKFAGTASGIMNTGSAVAAIASPVAFGLIVDKTGSWVLPFVGSIVLLLFGAALAFTMHPERPLDEHAKPMLPPAAGQAAV